MLFLYGEQTPVRVNFFYICHSKNIILEAEPFDETWH